MSRWRGTKTEAIAFDQDGNEVVRGTSRFGNVLIDFDQALLHIMEAINQCQKSLMNEHCVCICLGLAGISGGNTNELILRLKRIRNKIEIFNDATIARSCFKR